MWFVAISGKIFVIPHLKQWHGIMAHTCHSQLCGKAQVEITNEKRARGVAQVGECLSFILGTTKKISLNK
jgi:hypothetical protein